MNSSYAEEETPPGIQIIGSLSALIFGLVGAFAVIMLFVRNDTWVEDRIFFLTSKIAVVSFATFIPLSTLLTIFRRTRGLSGYGFLIVSNIHAFNLWIMSLIILNRLGGRLGVIIGLGFAGIGVIPVSIIIAAYHSYWSAAGEITITGILVLLARFLGVFLVAKHETSK